MLRWFAVLVLIAILGGGAFAAWKYFQWSQNEIRTLSENNAKLDIAINTEQQRNEILARNQVKYNELNQELTQKLNEALSERKDLEKLFRKHNLTDLSIAKPGLIENRINAGTQKVFKDLESLTKNE